MAAARLQLVNDLKSLHHIRSRTVSQFSVHAIGIRRSSGESGRTQTNKFLQTSAFLFDFCQIRRGLARHGIADKRCRLGFRYMFMCLTDYRPLKMAVMKAVSYKKLS